jgi:hypothetical protein
VSYAHFLMFRTHRGDRLAVVLLQCAHELHRDDELEALSRFYARGRPIPFDVAFMWCVVDSEMKIVPSAPAQDVAHAVAVMIMPGCSCGWRGIA